MMTPSPPRFVECASQFEAFVGTADEAQQCLAPRIEMTPAAPGGAISAAAQRAPPPVRSRATATAPNSEVRSSTLAVTGRSLSLIVYRAEGKYSKFSRSQ